MRTLTAMILGTGLLCGLAAGSAQAQMSPGPVVGPAVTSEAARQSGASDSMAKKDMEHAKDKMDDKDKAKDMDKAKDKMDEHKDKKPN